MRLAHRTAVAVAVALLFAIGLNAQSDPLPQRVLMITHSAGFEHASIPRAVEVLTQLATESGRFEITASDDISLINAQTLEDYAAVLFFTSGELPITENQKQDLLAFVRSGKGFGGFHSATDTFYQWPEYGELIGGYFDGHPWTQAVQITVEDPENPLVSHLAPSFEITDEIYQFRDFSRDRVRVLLGLHTPSVDLNAEGAHSGTDFPLVWIRPYEQGRVFYSALGHFDEVWDDAGVQQMLLNSVLWLDGQMPGVDATPHAAAVPQFTPDGIANAASFQPRNTISPGSAITIFGNNLTDGRIAAADPRDPPDQLAGVSVRINGEPIPLFYASPAQINAYVPFDVEPYVCQGSSLCPPAYFDLAVTIEASPPRSNATRVHASAATPGVFALTRQADGNAAWLTFWATGMGEVIPFGDLYWTPESPKVTVDGVPVPVQFSGLAPGWHGLYQVNARSPALTSYPARVRFQFRGYTQNFFLFP